MLKMREWESLWAGRLSANAKKVSANAKSSFAAILTLQASDFLNTFVEILTNNYNESYEKEFIFICIWTVDSDAGPGTVDQL